MVTASFSLHHITEPAAKATVFAKAFASLAPGGVLIDADCVTAADGQLQKRDFLAWHAHLAATHGKAGATKFLRAWADEDTYFTLDLETSLLRDAGFVVDVPWRRGRVRGDRRHQAPPRRPDPPRLARPTPAYNPRVSNFWEVFEAAARRFPDNIAVEVQRNDRLDQVGYRDLLEMAEAVARWLLTQGVAGGDRCAILADNDARWCAVYLGMLRIGAVAVPLDTNYSATQVQTVLSASGARLLVSGTRLLSTGRQALAAMPMPLVRMYADEADPAPSVDTMIAASSHAPLPPCPATSGDAAVILYTSGTTADPKGVVLTHGNLAAEREAAFAVVDVNERDAVLGVLPLFHSLAQMANLLLPFAVGARVVYLETLNTTDLLKALAERADHHLRLRAAVLLPDPPAGDRRGRQGQLADAHDVPRAALDQPGAAQGRRQPRAGGVRPGARGARRSHAAAHHRGIEVRPGDRPRPLRPRLHHPPGLRPDRDVRRRRRSPSLPRRTSTRSGGCCPGTI